MTLIRPWLVCRVWPVVLVLAAAWSGGSASASGGIGLGPGDADAGSAPADPPTPAAPPAAVAAPAAAPPAAKEAAAARPLELELETTDGVALRAWHYPAVLPDGGRPAGTVILLHDLAGSHRSVETLAMAIQAAGCDVVSPDLRGHGDSTNRGGENYDLRTLKKPDLELMAASRGGQIRDQALIRGDVEAVRNWIRRQVDDGGLAASPLFVVGSGVGAAVAATWTAEDANWPVGTKGPQGRQVAGLVLISPTWAARGFSMNTALANETLKGLVPVLVIAGASDRDAGKVFDHLKRQRPAGWFQQRADRSIDKAAKLDDPAKASLFFFEFDSPRTADALAADRGLDPAAVITKFFTMAGPRPKR